MDGLTVLARGAVDGDDVALAELVRRTQHTVEAVCRVLADADDVETSRTSTCGWWPRCPGFGSGMMTTTVTAGRWR